MALNKRDQRTLTITLSLLVGFVVWSFGIEPVWQSYQNLDETLISEENKWRQNQKTLGEAKSIDEGYARVEAQFPQDDPDRDPSEVFSEEVVDLVADTVGIVPQYSPPATAAIKGATGYEFLIMKLTVKSPLPKVASLLQEFDSKGFLIQTATITRDSDLDKNELTVDLDLGRIVKIAVDESDDAAPRPGSLRLGRGGAR